jgi:hypothetical protein
MSFTAVELVRRDFLDWMKSLSTDESGSRSQRAVRVTVEDALEAFIAAFPAHNSPSSLGALRLYVGMHPELQMGFQFDMEKWRCIKMHARA